jgi:nicotinate-nucleotide adenylyltransferase
MRIGLFGGTFNPIHLGHLRAALEVQEGFSLDRILFIPSALPPHKAPLDLAESTDRMNMVRLAVAQRPGFAASDVEIKRSGPSYTVDTVRHLKTKMPEGTTNYLIVGLDAFLEVDTWKSYTDLFAQIPLIVISRPESARERADQWRQLDGYLKKTISGDLTFNRSQSCYEKMGMLPIYWYEVSALAISSTRIRQLRKSGRSIDFLVTKEVADYITSRGLYV